MNKKLKKDIKEAFEIEKSENKESFFEDFNFPKARKKELIFTQISYISLKFWITSSILLLILILLRNHMKNSEIVYILSAVLPLLTLAGISEMKKSSLCNMHELEMTCKFNLEKIIFIRTATVASFHFIILMTILLMFSSKNSMSSVRYVLYVLTPYLLNTGLSLFVANRLKMRDMTYVCSTITILISLCIFIASNSLRFIFNIEYTIFWLVLAILSLILIFKELKKLILQTEELQWNLN